MPKQLTEAQFQEQVVQLAHYSGWKVFHPRIMQLSEPGWPDLVLVRPPQVLFIELKSATGKATPAQLEWLDLLSECTDVDCSLWRPDDWEHIRRTLQRDYRQRLEQVTG